MATDASPGPPLPPAPPGSFPPWALARWSVTDLVAVTAMPFGIAAVVTVVLIAGGASSPAWGFALTLVQQLAMGPGVAWWVQAHERSLAPIGVRRGGTSLRDVGAGIAAGVGAIAASALVIGIWMEVLGRTDVPNPLRSFGDAWLVPSAIMALLLAPVCEEVLFRGFVFGGLRQRLRFGWAAIVSGLVFGAIHGDVVRFPGLVVTGVILAAVYERRRTLGASVAAHATVNALALLGLLAQP